MDGGGTGSESTRGRCDKGVFQQITTQSKIPYVSPVQVYLDLALLLERAAEAAKQVKGKYLKW
jgi:hypothetical protein